MTFLITLFSLTSIAQTVYFGSISKKTSVGLGINGNNVILSIMEINKSKKFDSFELRLYDMNMDKIKKIVRKIKEGFLKKMTNNDNSRL